MVLNGVLGDAWRSPPVPGKVTFEQRPEERASQVEEKANTMNMVFSDSGGEIVSVFSRVLVATLLTARWGCAATSLSPERPHSGRPFQLAVTAWVLV